jgi:hypothetical protein
MEVQRNLPGLEPAAPGRLRRRETPGEPVPGQPALDPDHVRRISPDAGGSDDARGPRRLPRRGPDAIRGANQQELWKAFAMRGFGEIATSSTESPEVAAASDTDPMPDFSSPFHADATVTFRAAGEAGEPVKARVYVGHYEARVSPIADTDAATSGSPNLDDTASFIPGLEGQRRARPATARPSSTSSTTRRRRAGTSRGRHQR